MSIKVDKIQLQIAIKHDKARQEIAEITNMLSEETRQLGKLEKAKRKAMKKYKDESHPEVVRATAAYQAQAERIDQLKKRKDELRRSLKIEGLSIAEVRDEMRKYNAQLSNLTPGTAVFNKTKKHLDDLKARLKDLNSRSEQAKSGLGKLTERLEIFNKYGFAVSGFNEIYSTVVTGIQSWAQEFVTAFASMDEAMTSVMKYTGQTKQQVIDMNEAFKQMDTRTSREQLNELAGAAGRLGISATKQIVEFVDAADKINVALGDDLGEGAIDQIGKLTMVFGEDKTKGLNAAMLATGSAINELGAASSANTGFITDFTSRMAGMAVQAHISQTDIMGYASALSQAGIEGDTASGVFAQFITKMFTNTKDFARAAGIEVSKFANLLKTDANKAILQFIEAMQARGGFDQLAPMLKSLKMQGTQAIPVLTSLAAKMNEVKEAQRLAAQAYGQGTSILNEFNNANSSAQAKIEMMQKRINDARAALGEQLMPVVATLLEGTRSSIAVMAQAATLITRHKVEVGALAAVVATYVAWKERELVADRASVVTKTAHTIAVKANTAAHYAGALAIKAWQTTVVLANAATALLRGGIGALRVQMALARMEGMALSASGFGAILGVVTVVGVAIYGLTKALRENSTAMRQQRQAAERYRAAQQTMTEATRQAADSAAAEQQRIYQLTSIIHSNAYSINERRAAIQNLQRIVPGYHATLTAEGQLHEKNAQAIQQHIDRINDLAMAQALADKMRQIQAEKFEAEQKRLRKQNNVRAVQTEINRHPERYSMDTPTTTVTDGRGGVHTYGGPSDTAIRKNRELQYQQRALDDANAQIKAIQAKENAINNYLRTHKSVQQQYTSLFTSAPSPTTQLPSSVPPVSDTDDKEERKRAAAAERRRKEEEELAKAERQKADLEAKQQYQQRIITEEQYHEQLFQNEMAYIQRIAKAREGQYTSEADRQEAQNMMLDAIIRREEQERTDRQRRMQNDLTDLQSSYNADLINISRQQLDGQIATQKEADDKRLELEIDYQRQRLAIIRQYGGDTQQAEADLAQRELQRYQQETAAKQEAFRREQEARIKAYTSGSKADQSPSSFSAGGSSAAAPSLQDALSSLDALHNAQLLSDQEYEQRRTEILQHAEQQRHDIRQAYFDQAQELMQSAASLFSALQQREESRVDQKYKRLIAAAKKSGADTSKLEEQQEAEKMAIKKKYAQKEFAMNILKILADTAVAIQGVWKEFPNPAVAIPITAMVSASAAMQLAAAKMQADQAAGLYGGGFSDKDALSPSAATSFPAGTSFSAGSGSAAANATEGYTGDGNPRDRAGYVPVHRREFVINHRALRQPAVMSMARIIDSYQRANRPELINATALLQSLQSSPAIRHPSLTAHSQEGFADGGFTDGLRTMSAASSPFSAGSSSAAAPHQETLSPLLQECRDLLRVISQDRGLTILELRDRIRRQQELEQRATRQ